MREQFELVGTVDRGGATVKILRQFDQAVGFRYFLEKEGELRLLEGEEFDTFRFDAFRGGAYELRIHPCVLDGWIKRSSCVDLRVYHIDENDLDAEIGGRKLREWWEKAIAYYESEEDMGLWKEYWGLLLAEREMLLNFLEESFQKNVSKDWWDLWCFRRKILSLGEYKEKLADHFIEHLFSYASSIEEPRNKAKAVLVWLKEYGAEKYWKEMLIELAEWDYLTAEEREIVERAIYDRLEELAEKEDPWAGLSLEEWLDMLVEKLVEDKVIKDKDAFWKWIKRYIERIDGDIYGLLELEFKENVDWYWMPRNEKKELAEALGEFILEKLEEEKEQQAPKGTA